MAYLLMVMGLAVIVYPYMKDRHYEQEQQKLLANWPKIQAEENKETTEKSKGSQSNTENIMPKNALGLLQIESITLQLPVLDDSKSSNLDIAPMKIKGTKNPGEEGNFSIAGHRNKKYGKNFNRLDELKIGDKAVFITGKQEYHYEVYKKQVVLPESVEVLKNKGLEEMTLVTCHPIGSSQQRLIVSLKRIH